MKNVLITGGAGFIGSNLSLKLIEKGYAVTVLDNLSTQIHGENPDITSPLFNSIKDKVKFIHGTVTSREDWVRALENQNYIVHLAAETGTGQSMYEVEKYVTTNIVSTAIMLDILANTKNDVKRVLVAESRAIYGEGRYFDQTTNNFVYPNARTAQKMEKGDFNVYLDNSDQPLKLVATTEDSKIHPTSVYGITKQVQGQLVHTVCKSIGIDSVSFRYQNVYGPGQSLTNPYTGILSIFSTRIRNGNPIYIFEDGLESRDFVYIDDVVDATILGLETENAKGHAFNVGTGEPTTVLMVANLLKEKFRSNVAINVTGNFRTGDIRHNFADLSLAKSILGYESKWNFEEGLEKFVKWVKNQEVEKDLYDTSIKELKDKGLYK